MVLVQGLDGYPVLLGHDDGIGRSLGRLDRCDVRHVIVHSAAPDLGSVLDGLLGGGRVYYQLDLAPFHVVQDVGATVEDLVHPLDCDPRFFQVLGCAVGGDYLQARICQLLGGNRNSGLVLIPDRYEDNALQGQAVVCRQLRLEEGQAQVVVYAHDLACGPHLRPEQDVGSRKPVEGQQHLFY